MLQRSSSRCTRALPALLLLAFITCQVKEDRPPSYVLEDGWPYLQYDHSVAWITSTDRLLFYRHARWEQGHHGHGDCDSTGFYEVQPGRAATPVLIGEAVCGEVGLSGWVMHPNATRFVYASPAPVGAAGPQEFQAIRIYDLAAGRSVRLTNQAFREPRCPAWTSDGQRVIAFGTTQPLGSVDTLRLFVIDPSDLSIRSTGVVLPDRVRCPSWSPSGDQFVIAVAGTRLHDGDIVVVDTLAQTRDTIAAGYTPLWSPTGEWIAYGRGLQMGDTLDAELRLVHPDGTDDHGLYRTDNADVHEGTYLSIRVGILTEPLVWSSDGRYVAFSRWFPQRGTELWIVTPDGRTVQRLTGSSGQ